MHSNCIKDLLDLKEVIIKSIKNLKDAVEIYIELPVVEHICPNCGSKTTKIHDYYTQPITDIPIYFKPTKIIYKKRRYECKKCSHSFFENNNLVNRYARKAKRLAGFIVDQLRALDSVSNISKRTSVDARYISRIIDGETHEVVDILECRYKHFLCDYFKKFPKEQLDNVKYFVTDLWETYKDIGFTYFRKAKIVADHFHWTRYACDAVNKIRIEVQNNLPKKKRIYFKHSRKLLLSRACNITDDTLKDELSYILINYSESLRIAYREKETLLNIVHSNEKSDVRISKFNE